MLGNIEKALWRSCAARADLLMCRKDLINPFYSLRRYCEARVGGREDRESGFHSCEACASLFMWGKKTWSRRFIHRIGVWAYLCARENRESRFHRCEVPVYMRERPDNDVLTSYEVL